MLGLSLSALMRSEDFCCIIVIVEEKQEEEQSRTTLTMRCIGVPVALITFLSLKCLAKPERQQ